MIEYIEISGIKTIVRLPDNYLCGRKYKVIFINDGEIVNNIEQPDNQIYVGLIHKNSWYGGVYVGGMYSLAFI